MTEQKFVSSVLDIAAREIVGERRTQSEMTGHIRRRGARSWEIKFELGTDPITGKRQTQYHAVKGTKRDAQKELDRLVVAADRGDLASPSKITLAAFLDRWERDWAEGHVSPKTLERYRDLA